MFPHVLLITNIQCIIDDLTWWGEADMDFIFKW